MTVTTIAPKQDRGITPAPFKKPAPPLSPQEKKSDDGAARKKVERIAPEPQAEKKKLRVAAYCRVSTMDEHQEGSIYAQKRHFIDLINENPEWELAGIYFEQGVSGTKAENRPELQRLILDCKMGRVSMILTKSISRFSRSVSDTLTLVRGLGALGVPIRFEEETIDTGTMQSEFMLSLLSCIAENESHSISANTKWAKRKQFEHGTFRISLAPYGYRKVDGTIEIEPEEAENVAWMFEAALSGLGVNQIAKELNERYVPTRNGNLWNPGTVYDILRNEVYTGDMLVQKTFTDENFKQRKNDGDVDQFLHANHHPAIVDHATFDLVQANMDQRGREKNVTGEQNRYAFSGKLVCGNCGQTMKRVKRKGYFSYACGCGAEPEDNVKNAFVTCLNKLAFSQKLQADHRVIDTFIERVKADEWQGNVQRLMEIEETLEQNELEANVLSAIARVKHFNAETHSKKMTLLKENENLRREKALLQTCATNTMKAEALRGFIGRWKGGAFPDDAFEEFVETVTVFPGDSVIIYFTCGLDLRESLLPTLTAAS